MKYYFLALASLIVICVGCSAIGDGQQFVHKHEYVAPPAHMMAHPGPMVDGPGPGVLPMFSQPQQGTAFETHTTQVLFAGPEGMHIGWQVPTGFAEKQLIAPRLYNFQQGNTYRLKLSNIEGRAEGFVVYPTLEIYPSHPTTDSYLSHSAVPIEITDEDLDQIQSNNLVTKVIYLPDPRFQELAIAGVETLVSTRLDPGVDPVAQADRQGTIMAVIRMGNMDLEMPVEGAGAGVTPSGMIQQASYERIDGAAGQYVPPMPIATSQRGAMMVPGPMIMGSAPPGPGLPAVNPISGVGGTPQWGMPITATPIGLPGPPHLPYGGPAGLRSHTVINRTKMDLGEPVDHLVLDVEHKPGIKLPHPTKYIKYTETHPIYHENEVAYPNWAIPGAGGSAPAMPEGSMPATEAPAP